MSEEDKSLKDFKLLAIVPLEGCSERYRKNLQIGTPYQFYENLSIELKPNKTKVVSVRPIGKFVPPEMYALKNGINVSVSALVGKNGSGKSALFELFYYVIYLIGINKTRKDNKPFINPYSSGLQDQLKWIMRHRKECSDMLQVRSEGGSHKLSKKDHEEQNERAIEICREHGFGYPKKNFNAGFDFLLFADEQLSFKFNQLLKLIGNPENPGELFKEEQISKSLALSIIYSVGNSIFEICYNKGEFTYNKFTPKNELITNGLESFDLEKFFYTVSVNYSHHALNSKSIGNWISSLFHKNDGYLTPVVINPMRDEGNFNINHESDLSKERLMANVIYDLIHKKNEFLLGKYEVGKFIFTLKSPIPYLLFFDSSSLNKLEFASILKKIVGIKKIPDNYPFWENAFRYLDDKIQRLKENYPFLIYIPENGKTAEGQLQYFLENDRSHITKKIRQTLHYLKLTKTGEYLDFWESEDNEFGAELTGRQMLEWLKLGSDNIESLTPSELVEMALPGFFNVDFELKDKNGQTREMNRLSSGEQQMILNINAILYHLYNLQSIHKVNSVNGVKIMGRLRYHHINIFLDEVELYYHPEMQRVLVHEILKSFEKIKNKNEKGIKSINLCFATHSPFILSDIPKQNVLRLVLDEHNNAIIESSNHETFGANLHELLADNFFMRSSIGEFSNQKIKHFIDFYYKVMSEYQELDVNDLYETSEFNRISKNNQLLRTEFEKEKASFQFLASNIGEDVIRKVVQNHYEHLTELIDQKLEQ